MNGWTPDGQVVRLTEPQRAWVDWLLRPIGRRLSVGPPARGGWSTALATAARIDAARTVPLPRLAADAIDIVRVGDGGYVAGFTADGIWRGCEHNPHPDRAVALRCAELRLALVEAPRPRDPKARV